MPPLADSFPRPAPRSGSRGAAFVRQGSRGGTGAAITAALLLLAGCDDNTGTPAPNQAPETDITSSVPAEGGVELHHLEVHFSGRDADGSNVRFEYLLHTYPRALARYQDITVFTPATDDPRWTSTAGGESPFAIDLVVLADTLRADPQGDIGAGHFDRWHTLYVRAIDSEGAKDETPAQRTFDAYTVAPVIWLLPPAVPGPETATLPRSFAMNWFGVDDIGDGHTQDPEAVRWVLVHLTPAEAADPALVKQRLYSVPESAWSDWLPWGPEAAARQAALYDVMPPETGDSWHAFAVQGLDDAGAITPQFADAPSLQNNYGILHVVSDLPVGPTVPVREVQVPLGNWVFEGGTAPAIQVAAAGVDSVTLEWGPMTTGHYGAQSKDYRYGWNITNINNDGEWSPWTTLHAAPPRRLSTTDLDVFYLQARDTIHLVTTARLEFQK